MILLEESMEQPQIADVANEKHSLYLRFPKKLNVDRTLAEAEVKSLNASIIRVRIPRQRSANFCLVDFATKEDQEKAEKKLKKVEIDGKRLVVKQAIRNDKHRKIEKMKVRRQVSEACGMLVGDIQNSLARNYARRNVTNGVMVRDLKSGITQNDIRRIFPEAIDIKMNVKADRKNSFALVWLPTPKDARAAASAATVEIHGEEYVVSLENGGKQKIRKRVNESSDSDSDADSSEEVSASEDSDDDDVVYSDDLNESD